MKIIKDCHKNKGYLLSVSMENVMILDNKICLKDFRTFRLHNEYVGSTAERIIRSGIIDFPPEIMYEMGFLIM